MDAPPFCGYACRPIGCKLSCVYPWISTKRVGVTSRSKQCSSIPLIKHSQAVVCFGRWVKTSCLPARRLLSSSWRPLYSDFSLMRQAGRTPISPRSRTVSVCHHSACCAPSFKIPSKPHPSQRWHMENVHNDDETTKTICSTILVTQIFLVICGQSFDS